MRARSQDWGLRTGRRREVLDATDRLRLPAEGDPAARIAAARGVRRTVLMHLSPRYQAVELERLEAEAREENEAAEVGKEGQWYEVGVRE